MLCVLISLSLCKEELDKEKCKTVFSSAHEHMQNCTVECQVFFFSFLYYFLIICSF